MKHSKILFLLLFSCDVFALELWQKYKNVSELNAKFSQEKEIKSLGVKLNSKGSLHFKRPDVFSWNVVEPKPFGFVFNKGTLSILDNGREVKSADITRMDPKMLNAITHLKAWLTMDDAFIESHYNVVKLSDTSYEFSPKGETKIFKSIQVETGAKEPVKKMIMTELSGDQITIHFSETKLTYEK